MADKKMTFRVSLLLQFDSWLWTVLLDGTCLLGVVCTLSVLVHVTGVSSFGCSQAGLTVNLLYWAEAALLLSHTETKYIYNSSFQFYYRN